MDGPCAWSADERLWWLLWSRVPGLGWRTLGQLRAAEGSLAAAWRQPVERLRRVPGLGAGRLAAIERLRQQWGAEPLQALRAQGQRGLGVLLPGDPALPRAVATLERPPLALYWSGRGSLWAPLRRRQAVAVVGTRRASIHGLAMAEAIGAALARAGWPVVSGLAEGIDAAAHQGCLAAMGRPVAVLGTSLERVYPRHHSRLQAQVASAGLLLSEQPPGGGVSAGHFAARNRLQVALAAALVLVECPASSGALHSVRLAWEQGLPLWVVPADAGKQSAAGSNPWLARGAAPLLDPAALVRALGPGPLRAAAPAQRAPTPRQPDAQLLAAVGAGASLQQLSAQLQLPAAQLTQRLLALELAGLLRAQPGLCWRPA
jgi:DNA processing protein